MLADEVNEAPPSSASGKLEAKEEKRKQIPREGLQLVARANFEEENENKKPIQRERVRVRVRAEVATSIGQMGKNLEQFDDF